MSVRAIRLTREYLLVENRNLRDTIIELQAEIIQLRRRIDEGIKETKREKDWDQSDVWPPYLKYLYPNTGTSDPFPIDPMTSIC